MLLLFLPRLNEQYEADLSAAQGLSAHPGTNPAPHVSNKEFLMHSRVLLSNFTRNTLNP